MLLLVGLAIVLLASPLLELLRGGPMPLPLLPSLSDIVAILLGAGAITLFLLADDRRPERAVPDQAARKAVDRGSDRSALRRRSALLASTMRDHVEHLDRRPGHSIAELNRQSGRVARWPWDATGDASFLRLAGELDAAADWLESDIIGRLVATQRVGRAVEGARAVVGVIHDYLYLEPVQTALGQANRESDPVTRISMAAATSVLAGTLILADASDSRSAAGRECIVWPSNAYTPGSGDVPPTFGTTHGLGHRRTEGTGECEFYRAFRTQHETKPGEFDGRVVSLDGVAVTQDEREEGVVFLLRTSEACYAATEARDPNGGLWNKSKGIAPEQAESQATVWGSHPSTRVFDRIDGRSANDVCLLTSFATVILHGLERSARRGHPGHARRSLILTKRSSRTRQGANVHSVTAGGVMNLPVGNSRVGDQDARGFPDPAETVRREALEELGVAAEDYTLTPTCVCLLNERGPVSSQKSATCQLVSTVAYTMEMTTTFEELQGRRAKASAAKGRYESEALVELPLPCPVCEGDPEAAAKRLADVVRRDWLERIDQRAYIAILYAAFDYYGQGPTLRGVRRPSLVAAPLGFSRPRTTIKRRAAHRSPALQTGGPRGRGHQTRAQRGDHSPRVRQQDPSVTGIGRMKTVLAA